MKKLILVDGNNLMFRSYFATAYSGSILKNSKGVPTNALYGFTSMINKIINEENPNYMVVAFDIGKNFRKEKYEFYKEGRNATPEELKQQMPIARTILDGMGIKHLELAPYEADDIIGTLVKKAALDEDFEPLIVSSDKDLLQLINFETDIKLLKKDDFVRYNENSFKKEWGIDPIRIIDLKALMGDASDNIPGVKGVGEKTALKLLQDYGSLENVYDNIDKIKGALHEKLVSDKDNAFMSKEIATIYQDVPLNVNFEDLKYLGPQKSLMDTFKDLEFYSFLKKLDLNKEEKIEIKDNNDINLDNDIALYMELDNENYHLGNVIGISITDKNGTYYFNDVKKVNELIKNKNVITYDYKKDLSKLDLNSNFDLMIAAYLCNINTTDDISTLLTKDGYTAKAFNELKKNKFNELEVKNNTCLKSKYLYEIKDKYLNLLKDNNLLDLFNKIEMPLCPILSKMENTGMKCDRDILIKMQKEISLELDKLTQEIYDLVGIEFNISSPKQLGDILFDKLELKGGKKNKTGYITDADTLEKLVGTHPVIEKILEYRNLSKLYNTYLIGLEDYIGSDGIIHPIFKQTLARTGRLSCAEPNLQNIPTKEELGRTIRKAFISQNGVYLSADYSQIELRILAHIANDERLIEAFNNGEDIHTHVAADIYGIKESEVTKRQRKTAKAVIFGIVYGISGFGLGENLHIKPSEAKEFIEKYYQYYPNVKKYMDNIINDAKEKGYVTTLMGRKRVLEELNSPNFMVRKQGERMALNTPIQGTSADIIKMAMISINEELKKKNLKSKLVLQIHDELIFDTYENELDELKKIVKDKMENVIKLSVPLKVEISCANNWYEV